MLPLRQGTRDRRIIGESDAILTLRDRIARFGASDAPVLILGERGTGKELVARALHEASARRRQPFIAVNCGGLAPDILTSELFGHERGAFTGAVARTAGIVRSAAGGTLFLDEIGHLSSQAQATLLRFLQEGEVRAAGSAETHHVDVRVIAATNRDLDGAIAEGEFGADLHDRLSVLVIEVPPLRERLDDIPLLAAHFLRQHARDERREEPSLSPDAMLGLRAQSWPGNVRQLENAMRRAVVQCQGNVIRPADFALAPPKDLHRVLSTLPDGHHVTDRQREVLGLVAARGTVRRADVIARFRICGDSAWRDLAALVARGLLIRSGANRGATYRLAQRSDPRKGDPR